MIDQKAVSEWREGWPLPFVSALGMLVAAFYLYSLGVFINPLEQEFGWSRTRIALGLSIVSAVSVIFVPLVGWQIDRRGPRQIALAAMLLYCLSIAALGLAGPSIWSWWLLWIPLALGSAGVSSALWTTAVASRFDKARGLALAITLCGSGLSSIIAPLMVNALVETFGWRNAYFASGAILAVISMPLLFRFFYGAADLERKKNGRSVTVHRGRFWSILHEGFRSSVFVRLALSGFLLMTAMHSFLIHFIPMLRSFGLTPGAAATSAAFIGAGSIAGRLIGGVLLDRLPATMVGLVAYSLPILVSALLLVVVNDPISACFTAFLLGLSLGSEMDVLGYLASRFLGMKNFGSLFGVIIALTIVALGVGPALGGLIYDITGSYRFMLYAVMPMFGAAALLVGTLGPYPVLSEDTPLPARNAG